jgi:hypothetical protein
MTDKIYLHKDGKSVEVKGKELEYVLSWQEEIAESERLIEAETTAKAEAKASAMAKLAALGLSDEEIQAIIGA